MITSLQIHPPLLTLLRRVRPLLPRNGRCKLALALQRPFPSAELSHKRRRQHHASTGLSRRNGRDDDSARAETAGIRRFKNR